MREKTAAILGCLLVAAIPCTAAEMPGISSTEITIGQTMPYTGPVSAFSALGRGEIAYFKKVNDEGGINGRRINLISLDDGYSPPKTVEQTRRLIEQDHVAFIFSSIGTAANSAIQKYLNSGGVPQLFIGSGASKFGNYKEFPWTIGGVQATFRVEARIYAAKSSRPIPRPGSGSCTSTMITGATTSMAYGTCWASDTPALSPRPPISRLIRRSSPRS